MYRCIGNISDFTYIQIPPSKHLIDQCIWLFSEQRVVSIFQSSLHPHIFRSHSRWDAAYIICIAKHISFDVSISGRPIISLMDRGKEEHNREKYMLTKVGILRVSHNKIPPRAILFCMRSMRKYSKCFRYKAIKVKKLPSLLSWLRCTFWHILCKNVKHSCIPR